MENWNSFGSTTARNADMNLCRMQGQSNSPGLGGLIHAVPYLPVSIPSAVIFKLVFYCALLEGLGVGRRLPLHIQGAQEPRVSDPQVPWGSNCIKNKAGGETESHSGENKPKAVMKQSVGHFAVNC